MKIGIDLDDTLNQLVPEWIKRYNEQYNDNLDWTTITNWNINEFVKCDKDIYKLLAENNLFADLNIQPHAREALEWLQRKNEIYIVTAYCPEACIDKAKWIERNLPSIPLKNLIFCNQKSLIDVDILIDDSPLNHKGFKGDYVIYEMPWNTVKVYPELSKFERINNWAEIIKRVV